MRIAIIGGKLQGIEAVYLLKKAYHETVVIDSEPSALAFSLADEYYCLDIIRDESEAASILASVDAVLPATENQTTLDYLVNNQERWGTPVIHDPAAYFVSSCKMRSNEFFRENNIPMPACWPLCDFPVVVKPSKLSGSAGVRRANNLGELLDSVEHVIGYGDGVIVQEFIVGPSLSVEVLGFQGGAAPLIVTELQFDDLYDCKRVIVPSAVHWPVTETFRKISSTLARNLHLTGIMDVEVMVDGLIPKVIEIDARLPSQTPTAVLCSTGINMADLIVEMYTSGRAPEIDYKEMKAVIYEHVQVRNRNLQVLGEHCMLHAGKLRHEYGFFGADEAITDFFAERVDWVATLIFSASDLAGAWLKRNRAIERIVDELCLVNSGDIPT